MVCTQHGILYGVFSKAVIKMISLNVPGFRIWTADIHEPRFTVLLTTDPATSAWSLLQYEAWRHLAESIPIFLRMGLTIIKRKENIISRRV
jgi:hypothetical protein